MSDLSHIPTQELQSEVVKRVLHLPMPDLPCQSCTRLSLERGLDLKKVTCRLCGATYEIKVKLECRLERTGNPVGGN